MNILERETVRIYKSRATIAEEKAENGIEDEFQWSIEKVIGLIGFTVVAFVTFYPFLIAAFVAEVSLIATAIAGSAYGIY